MTRRGPGSRRDGRTAKSTKDWRGEDPNLELEQLRYADPIASRELLLKHLSEAPEPLTASRLAKRLGLDTERQREALAKRLAAMVRDGQAIEGPNGFATAGEGERVAGRVRGRANGEVLVMPDDGSAPLVLARVDTATLMHNYRVEVLAVGMNERDRHGAKEGDNVIVEVTKRPQGDAAAHGRIVEILDNLRPSDLAARFAILRHDLPQEFPPEVLHDANLFAPDVPAADIE